MIKRLIQEELKELLTHFPAIALVGPRQVGKTTLAHFVSKILPKDTLYIDLENPRDEAKLTDPVLFFESQEDKCIILDEIQRRKDLFPILRSMIDAKRVPARFILLGSASPELIRDTSESLAGRIYYKELTPFHFLEIEDNYSMEDHWLKGGFPNSLLNTTIKQSTQWRMSFIQTYIERDLPALGFNIGNKEAKRFVRMLAHLQGQLMNYQSLAKSLGISSPTAKKYVEFLEHAFLVRLLEPYHRNIGKRLVKSSKLYLRDSGLLHTLNDIDQYVDLLGHPLVGASWEAYVIEQIITVLPENYSYYFYRTQQGAELDFVIVKGGKPIFGIEIKFSVSPQLTRGNYVAMEDLGLTKIYVIIPNTERYLLKNNVEVLSLKDFLVEIQ